VARRPRIAGRGAEAAREPDGCGRGTPAAARRKRRRPRHGDSEHSDRKPAGSMRPHDDP
jgi:hypothetical protein